MPRVEPRQIGLSRQPGGARVTVRPACRWDAGRMDYVRGLSASTRYDRFLAPVNELSAAELERIGVSDDRQATLVAETRIAGARTVIGEARYAASDRLSCEIAVSVAEAWCGRGVGTLLLEYLECRARSLGASTLVGDVLRSNAAMRTLARKAGFAMAGVPADARLVRILKDISARRVGMPCARLMASGLSIAA
jgi:acetyltransferase